MATQISIGNKTTSIPGVYSQIKSGIVNPQLPTDYGNVLIIDDGSLAIEDSLLETNGYIAINGVEGENRQGADSALVFTDVAEVQSMLWDSPLLPIVKSLFMPARRRPGVSGANKVTIVQAAETTAAETTITFTNAQSPLKLKSQFEGVSVNGHYQPKTYEMDDSDPDNPPVQVVLSNELGGGFACRLEAGKAFGYSLVFYKGVHIKQEDPLNPGFGYDEKPLVDIYSGVGVGEYNVLKPQVLFRSPDLRRLSELKKWMQKSPSFKKWFKIEDFVIDPSNDMIVAGDLAQYTALAPYNLFSGGTTNFTPAAFNEAVDLSKSFDNSFYLSLQAGDQATSVNNTAIYNLLVSGELNWEKFMFVAGYDTKDDLLGDMDCSQAVAAYYNSSKVIVTHGSAKTANTAYPDGYRNISTLEKTAKILGRIAGLPPQTPITWKDIDIAAENHKLLEGEKEAVIEAGILCTNYDFELTSFVILAGINSLGNNDFLINEDAQSYSIQIERIKSQLNKELIFGAKRTFFGGNTGPNRNTVSPASVRTWTIGFLESKVATNERDNLIIRFANVTAKIDQDNVWVEYEFVPNSEVNKIIFQGVMLAN